MSVQTMVQARRLVCRGTPAELGQEQGGQLGAQIVGARDALRQLESFRLEQPGWLPFGAFRHLAERKARRLLDAPLRRQFPGCHARLLATAESAGVRPQTLFLLNAVEALLSAVRDRVVVPPLGGCSTVVVRGRRSSTGEPMIAKNFDYLPLVQPFYFLRESRPDSRFRSIEFTVAPLVGSIDGMNEHGLCICNNYAFTVDTPTPAATVSMVIAEALACCSTVSEAADFIAAQPRWGSGLLMLVDASGDMGSLEISNTQCRLRRPEPNCDVLAHTNVFHTPEMQAIEVPAGAVFTNHAPRALRGTRLHESAEMRDRRIQQLLNDAPVFGPDELAILMADHGPNGIPTKNTICVHSDYWNTTAALQLFPRRRALRFDFTSTCSAQWQELELKS